jgi:hypothetical protein
MFNSLTYLYISFHSKVCSRGQAQVRSFSPPSSSIADIELLSDLSVFYWNNWNQLRIIFAIFRIKTNNLELRSTHLHLQIAIIYKI